MLSFNLYAGIASPNIYSPTNRNPIVYTPKVFVRKLSMISDKQKDFCEVEQEREPFDDEEVFDIVRGINDPEHPLTLEELQVTTVRLWKYLEFTILSKAMCYK